MVGPGKGDHKLSAVLIGAVDGHTLGLEQIGVHYRRDVVQQVWRAFKQLTGLLAHCLLKNLRIVA